MQDAPQPQREDRALGAWLSLRCYPDRRVLCMVYSPTMKITSTTDLEFPGLKFAIRQGEVKDLPADPEAAAFILASVYIREVPEPESETTRKHT
jgi:hypothetical protein